MTYYKCGGVYTTQNSNVVVDTASGAIANFNTQLCLPLLKTKFDVNAKQDLHGYDHPWPAGGGVNKFDKDTMIIDDAYINDTDGTQRENVGDKCTDYIEVLPDTNYYILTEQTVGRWGAWYDENKVFISGINNYRAKTAPSNAKYARFTIVRQGDGNPDKFGVNYPATNTEYHPYSNICPITGVGVITYVRAGKNLCNPAPPTPGAFWGTNFSSLVTALNRLPVGTYTLSNVFRIDTLPSPGSDEKFSVQHGPIKIRATVNGSIVNVNSVSQARDQYATRNKTYNEKTTFEITESIKGNITEALLYCDKYNTHSGSSRGKYSVLDIMVETGSTKTTFVSASGKYYIGAIDLGGTYYGGYISKDKDGMAELVVTHGFIQYNGLSGQAWRRASNGVFYIDGFSGDVIPYKSSYYKCLSTRVSSTSGALGYPKYIVSQLISNNTRFMVYDADISSDTEFNSNLENKPLELVYELAEPYTIALPDGQPIKSLPGINNIYADTGDTSLQFAKIGN